MRSVFRSGSIIIGLLTAVLLPGCFWHTSSGYYDDGYMRPSYVPNGYIYVGGGRYRTPSHTVVVLDNRGSVYSGNPNRFYNNSQVRTTVKTSNVTAPAAPPVPTRAPSYTRQFVTQPVTRSAPRQFITPSPTPTRQFITQPSTTPRQFSSPPVRQFSSPTRSFSSSSSRSFR